MGLPRFLGTLMFAIQTIFSVPGSPEAPPTFHGALDNFKGPPIFPVNYKAPSELTAILSVTLLTAYVL